MILFTLCLFFSMTHALTQDDFPVGLQFGDLVGGPHLRVGEPAEDEDNETGDVLLRGRFLIVLVLVPAAITCAERKKERKKEREGYLSFDS
jgi:hypothetical protein